LIENVKTILNFFGNMKLILQKIADIYNKLCAERINLKTRSLPSQDNEDWKRGIGGDRSSTPASKQKHT